MINNLNIMIVGVGGQGTLLASRILGEYASLAQKDCKLSEVHGMSQRGGSVVTYVKIADKVYSPTIGEKSADIILSFEELEALRWANYLKPEGSIVINAQKINPMPVVFGSATYPENIGDKLSKYSADVTFVDAFKLAEECGNVKVVNTIMIGALSKKLKLDTAIMLKALENVVKAELLGVNVKAFEMGYRI